MRRLARLLLLCLVFARAGLTCDPYAEHVARGQALQREARWIEAAETFLQVDPSWTVEGGEVIPVGTYAWSRATAGFCFLRAYQAQQDPDLVSAARACLREATRVAREREEATTLSLVALYTGQLEEALGHEDLALVAFEGVTPAHQELWSRACYHRVRLHQRRGDLAAAEACASTLGDVRDRFTAYTAYTLAGWWDDLARRAPERVQRGLFAGRAAAYARRFLDCVQQGDYARSTLTPAHLRFLARLCRAVGREADAREVEALGS
ncbi:MAG: hypothetical protein R3F62_03255 [Planctomycetota bacterium]